MGKIRKMFKIKDPGSQIQEPNLMRIRIRTL
jgi:hypothetical protein